MRNLFFSASNDVVDQITDLYDFVWPTASAMWNFRWQIKGFVDEVGRDKVTEKDLGNRFDWGSEIHGVNLRRACLEKTWEEQQEQFAKFLLINLCSVYEGWIEAIQPMLGFKRSIADNLQFPTNTTPGAKYPGIQNSIAQINVAVSPIMQNAFYPTLLTHPKNSLAQLENLLICYRYFKECRNSLAHRGGLANKFTEDSYLEFSKIATPANLNAKEVPHHYPITNGQPVRVSLRGVVGFGDVIIKIIATLDSEFSQSAQAQNDLLVRLGSWAANSGKGNNSLKKDPDGRKQKILRIFRALEFPELSRTDEVETLLIQNRILVKNYA